MDPETELSEEAPQVEAAEVDTAAAPGTNRRQATR